MRSKGTIEKNVEIIFCMIMIWTIADTDFTVFDEPKTKFTNINREVLPYY